MKRKEFLISSALAAGATILPNSADVVNTPAKKSFRFAFISDIHIKPEPVPENGMTRALQNIQNLKPEIDFIINGGDSIMDALAATKESTQRQWDVFHQIMTKENRLPIYHCIGNHDIYGWFQKDPDPLDELYGKNWALKELKISDRYYHFQKGKWNFIVLDSTQLNPLGGYIGKID